MYHLGPVQPCVNFICLLKRPHLCENCYTLATASRAKWCGVLVHASPARTARAPQAFETWKWAGIQNVYPTSLYLIFCFSEPFVKLQALWVIYIYKFAQKGRCTGERIPVAVNSVLWRSGGLSYRLAKFVVFFYIQLPINLNMASAALWCYINGKGGYLWISAIIELAIRMDWVHFFASQNYIMWCIMSLENWPQSPFGSISTSNTQ